MNDFFQEQYIDQNICRWSLNVYNCKDGDYFRSVYIIKLVISICVSLLDSALIIYRLGIKRRNVITPYGIASIDGLLLFASLYAYATIYHSINILNSKVITNLILQEYSFQIQFIFVLISLQIYLTGTLNASPKYPGSTIHFPKPKTTNIISLIALIIWLIIEIIGIFFVAKNRSFFYVSSDDDRRNKYDYIYGKNKSSYVLWVRITYLTFCGACFIVFLLFLLFGINLVKAANHSLEQMYRTKKIKANIVVPIRIAILKMQWISFACNVIMALFAILFGFMAFGEELLYKPGRANEFLSKMICVAMNLVPPACIFVTLLCIVYGEARSDIITSYPSTHYEEEYQMNYTMQSDEKI